MLNLLQVSTYVKRIKEESVSITISSETFIKMFNFENAFITTLLVLLAIYYIHCLWKNRRLYYYGSKIEGGLSLPIIGNTYLMIGDVNVIINKLLRYYDKYQGPFVKFWFCHNLCILPKQPKHFEILLKGHVEKSFLYDSMKTYLFKNGLVTAPVEVWKNHRKMINQTFSQNILNLFVEIFIKNSTKFVKDIKDKCDRGQIDIFPMIFRNFIHTVCETTLGITSSEFNELDDIISRLIRVQRLLTLRMIKPWRNLFWKLPDEKLIKSDTLEVEKFVDKIIRLKRLEKNKEESPKKYFLNHLINLENDKLTDHEIYEETQNMIITGSETVAITSSFVILMMALYPEIQEEAYREISEILEECGPITYYKFNKMNRLDRIIKETLRLFPTVPALARSLNEDVYLDSYVLPKGSTSIFPIIALHRNPEFWPDPLKFNPDRFLPEEIAKRPSGCYMPFGFGPRNCIGFKYAEMSMKILLALFIKSFKITTTQYKAISDIKLQYQVSLMAKNGFKFELEERK